MMMNSPRESGAEAKREGGLARENAETQKQQVELTDYQGEVIGQLSKEIIVWEPQDSKDFTKAEILRSLIIEDQSRQKEIDVLKLVNPSNTKIVTRIISPERFYFFSPFYNPDEEVVIFNRDLETPTDLALLFHELGHVDQFCGDEYNKNLLEFSFGWQKTRSDLEEEGNFGNIFQNYLELVEIFPELSPENLNQKIDEVKRMVSREEELQNPLIADRTSKEVQAELAELKQKKFELDQELKLIKIVNLPKRLAERYATAKAYEWLVRIRQETGVNLFVRHKFAPDDKFLKGIFFSEDEEDDQGNFESAEFSASQALSEGLKSHQARDVKFNINGKIITPSARQKE